MSAAASGGSRSTALTRRAPIQGAMFAILAMLLASFLATAISARVAWGAVQASPYSFSGMEEILEESQDSEEKKRAAASEISGSPWPGVIDHVLQKSLSDADAEGADILINYPSLGNGEVDSDIRQWVSGIAQAFTGHLDLEGLTRENPGGDLPLDDDSQAGPRFELSGTYSISRPSKNAVSVTFELWNYTGASHGNLDIITLNYNLLSGQRLDLVDMFEDPELALKIMSDYARKELEHRLGAMRRTQMLLNGTEALAENFASLTLTPGGMNINFQPYQVAPWEAGIQKVELPLDELLPAGPLLALWGK